MRQYMAPLSRQSQSNSHAMTVKEHGAIGGGSLKRSLSLCSISEHIGGSRLDVPRRESDNL